MDWLAFALIATLSWGIAPIFAKLGLAKVDPLSGLALRTASALIVLAIIIFATGSFKRVLSVPLRSAGFMIVEGIVSSLIGQLAFYYTLKLGGVSKAVPITSTYPLVTVILATLILGERMAVGRVCGSVLVVLGVFLIIKS